MRNFVGGLLPWLALKSTGRMRVNGDEILAFLAAHRMCHQILTAAAKSRPCRSMVRAMCRHLVARYGDVDPGEIFSLVKDFRNFSEGTEINAVSEIYERSLGTRWMDWISGIVRDLDHEAKAKLLTRILYNIVLKGINRKIADMRHKPGETRIPNLSTVFLATSSRCNLECKDCESAFERGDGAASFKELDYIMQQARKLNIFHVVIIGKGEPLFDESHKAVLYRLASKHWDINFILFTNGTTITPKDALEIRRLGNLFTLVSVDGLKQTNDERRGPGVFDRVCATMKIMNDHRLSFGFSSTVFRANYREILSEEFLRRMSDMGCKTGIYLMYLPLSGSSAGDMLLRESDIREYEGLYSKAKEFTPIPIVDPEIFERVHGCRARRGSTIYIDAATGKVTPCVKTPFAPAACNIYVDRHKNRLREILEMDFYVGYRNGYNECSQCSLNLEKELSTYLSEPNLTPNDREKAERYLARISDLGSVKVESLDP